METYTEYMNALLWKTTSLNPTLPKHNYYVTNY